MKKIYKSRLVKYEIYVNSSNKTHRVGLSAMHYYLTHNTYWKFNDKDHRINGYARYYPDTKYRVYCLYSEEIDINIGRLII